MSRLFQRYSSPSAFLDHQLHEIRASEFASEVFRQWPELRDITERFCWLVGDRVRLQLIRLQAGEKGAGGPVASVCLIDALSWLDQAPRKWLSSDRAARSLFLAGLLYNVPFITHLSITANGQPWTIETGAPMCELLAGGAQIESHLRTDLGSRFSDGMAPNRLILLNRMYPATAHMDLPLDTTLAVFPPQALLADLYGADEDV